jgi:hypothetical protein
VTCATCGKSGHVKKACWEVNPTLKPDWTRSKEPLRGQARVAAIANLKRQMADISAQLAQLRGESPERAHRANRWRSMRTRSR